MASLSIPVHVETDVSVQLAAKLLQLLQETTLFKLPSDLIERVLFDLLEIKQVDGIACGAGVTAILFISDDNIKFLSALLAGDSFGDREVPFHERALKALNEKIKEEAGK